MTGLYSRVENPKARILPNEVNVLLRDYHARIKALEEANERLKKPTSNRSRSNKLSNADVSTS